MACSMERFLKVCVMPSSAPSVAVTVLDRANDPPMLAPRLTAFETPEVTEEPVDIALPMPLVTVLPREFEMAWLVEETLPTALAEEWEDHLVRLPLTSTWPRGPSPPADMPI